MKLVIFAGGLGTRISEETDYIPKPMVKIGNKPILWHIIKYYSVFGFTEFIICGGSLIMSASMLALLDICEAIETGTLLDPKSSKRKVLGLDIDIRQHNREAIEAHPMSSRIQMIQGSSIAPEVIEQVKSVAKNYQRVLVCLDSNHAHEHVLGELEAYAPLTSVGSYCVVFDTIVEDMPKSAQNFFIMQSFS